MKRISKSEREASQKDALRQRLTDMAKGAIHGYSIGLSEEDGGLTCQMGLEKWCGFMNAVEKEFCEPLETEWNKTIRWYDAHHFDTIDGAVELLWSRGVR